MNNYIYIQQQMIKFTKKYYEKGYYNDIVPQLNMI